MRAASHSQTDHDPGSSVETCQDSQGGIAVMAVIWTIAIASAITLVALSVSSAYVQAVSVRNQAVKLSAAADAGLFMAIDELLQRDSINPAPHDGTPKPAVFDDIPLIISVQDTAGLVDMNAARPALLAALFEGLGASSQEASQLADEIIDWRDPDRRPTGTGGEAQAYSAAGLSYGPKNNQFVSLNELGQIIHFPAPWITRLDSVATIHSGLTGIDPTKASPELLELLNMSQNANLQSEPDQQTRPYLAASSTRVFRIRSQATSNGAVFVRDATVRINPGGFPAFDMLEWGRGHEISNLEIH
ncbi:general secretion pathway protein GspK [Hyphomonas sp.]|uniref:general secretion pathway protein GspK n=1 Tax=Hyphomonas sp. TaxID=87 RepID=UPI003526F4E8